VSGFKLAKYRAVKTTLRGDMMNQFCYKWYFIYQQQDNVAVKKKTGWEYDQGNS
jgi:hypothetical protein